MYTLIDDGILSEVVCGNNFEYVLGNNAHFVNTDFKVLQSQTNGIFIPCMKMMRNGKLDLYYLTENYRPMSSMFVGIKPDVLISVVINLFTDVIEVRDNGFLACQSIDLSWNKIFVEHNTLKVKLVYIPVSVRVFDSYAAFESELRASIVKLINKLMPTTTERLDQFVADLCNGSMTLDEVCNKSRSAGAPPIVSQQPDDDHFSRQPAGGVMKIVAMDAPEYFEIVIDRQDMLLGKKRELVDAVIPFNKMISRKHCRIVQKNGNYYISDEGSANGTYVNRKRLAQGQRIQINRGDVIRLADSDFQVV